MHIYTIKLYIYIILFLYLKSVFSAIHSLSDSEHTKLVGKNLQYTIPSNNNQSLEYYSKKFQVGLRNILEVNPNIDLYLPDPGKVLIIPKQLILPDTSHTGIIINSAETRLFYYPKNSNIVVIFPISIGTSYHATPSSWSTTVKYKKKPYLDSYERYA